jgi:hypothetical protein
VALIGSPLRLACATGARMLDPGSTDVPPATSVRWLASGIRNLLPTSGTAMRKRVRRGDGGV